MKKFLFILSVAFVGFLTSCSEKIETSVTPQNQAVDNATAARLSTVVKTEFPAATNIVVVIIDDKKVYGCDFLVSGVSHECTVSGDGKVLSSYKTSDNIVLPDAIKTYLETTYKGYKLEKSFQGKDAAGKASYKVLIEYNDQRITLVFDDKNAVIATFVEPKNNTGGDKNKVYASKLTDLPTNIQSQLAGYEFIGAIVKTNSDNSKKTYFVSAKKDGIFYEFTFDNDGKLTKTESFDPSKKPVIKELKESDLPQTIKDYLKINYKDWKFEQGTILTKDGKADSYSLILSKDKKLALLLFDKDGKFVKAAEVPKIEFPKIEVKDLTATDIPKVIKDYLTKTYSGWVFNKGNVTLKDGAAEAYYLNITVGTDKYQVYFDKDGKFVLAKRG
jgi:Putative beta-lactamase-inhibitor-like, PepSY-like